MGYNGMGYQRWIATMKPRKFLSKRSKPDGGGGDARHTPDIGDYYHIDKRDFSWLRQKNTARTTSVNYGLNYFNKGISKTLVF